jgi:ubiquitin C-terminal hydrolase
VQINDPLDIPLQLNLREFCTNNSLLANDANAGNYQLSAVVIHSGSIEQGHYYTLAKVPKHPDHEDSGNHWVQLNDHRVLTMTEEAVLKLARGEFVTRKPTTFYEQFYGADAVSTNAYLLFYTLIE